VFRHFERRSIVPGQDVNNHHLPLSCDIRRSKSFSECTNNGLTCCCTALECSSKLFRTLSSSLPLFRTEKIRLDLKGMWLEQLTLNVRPVNAQYPGLLRRLVRLYAQHRRYTRPENQPTLAPCTTKSSVTEAKPQTYEAVPYIAERGSQSIINHCWVGFMPTQQHFTILKCSNVDEAQKHQDDGRHAERLTESDRRRPITY
jgi:hypothetical protein